MTDTVTLEDLEPAQHAGTGAQGVIPIDSIVVPPEQERDQGDLTELAASIKLHGVLNPVLVRQDAGGYTLIAGGRRLAAAKLAGLTEIPVHAKQVAGEDDVSVMRLVENVQRKDLHPIEEAEAYEQLRTVHGMTQKQIARSVGRSTLHVSKRLSLLNLHEDVRGHLQPGGLTIGEAEDVARLSDPEEQRTAAREIMEGGDSEQVVTRRLAARERTQSQESVRQELLQGGEVEFTGALGKDGFPVSDEPQPGYLYWPEGRGSTDVQDFQFTVNGDGSVTWITTNPEIHIGDEDAEVVASATALVQRRAVALGEAGTIENPLQPATKDEAERERAKAERARLKMLKRRDEEREAHLNKLVRRGVAYPKVGEFVLDALIAAAPAPAKEVAFTRCRVPQGQRQDGFGEEWKLDQYLADTKGDGMLRLAYALALQLHEDVLDKAVKDKAELLAGRPAEMVATYLDFLGGTGYPGSAEEFALIGEQEPEDTGGDPADDPDPED